MAGPAAIPPEMLSSAAVAYGHVISFMVCFAALALERHLIQPNPNRQDAMRMVIIDVVYGLAALTLVLSGILTVLFYGRGTGFYTGNPLFWWKVGTYLAVGVLSLYPTITCILWASPLRRGELPEVSEAMANRLRWVINLELVGFAAVPLLTALVAQGIGLPL